jgi:serine/threonine protein kinase
MQSSPLSQAQSRAFVGELIGSEYHASVSYRLERIVGHGGMAIAYLATRLAPDGQTPVVVKLTRPNVVIAMHATASMVVQKEAVALGRLNERVPPTPFVVRLLDTGAAPLMGPRGPLLPWLALEYVHGGVEGTTLVERLHYSCYNTGYAFDSQRAAHLTRCLASGLGAAHGVEVIHRDLTPRNVLCCGFGENEIFKISDFGIAKPTGLHATFGDGAPGTPGYAAPEQSIPGAVPVGTYTDVFSLACLLYFVLTGESYFDSSSPVNALMSMKNPARRSVLEGRWLSPELRARPDACAALDRALARSTSEQPRERPEMAQEFAASIVPWLTTSDGPPRPSMRLKNSVFQQAPASDVSSWQWTLRHPGGDGRVVRSAAWDMDGHCLVTTTAGPAFWTGQTWVDSLPDDLQLPAGIRFARRIGAGSWLVGGESGMIATYTNGAMGRTVQCPDTETTFTHGSGRCEDLLAAVSDRQGQPPTLWAMAANRWLRPLPLTGVAYVASLLPLDDSRWLVCGRLSEGGGFAAIYTPLWFETTVLLTPRTRAFVSGCSEPERRLALLVGGQGIAVRVDGEQVTSSVVDGMPDLTASAMDVLDREWVASLGCLWVRDPAADTRWRPVWKNPDWTAPFVSLMADTGLVVAMTADGGIVEGRAV